MIDPKLIPGREYLRSLNEQAMATWLNDEFHGRPHTKLLREENETPPETVIKYYAYLGLSERGRVDDALKASVSEWKRTQCIADEQAALMILSLFNTADKGIPLFEVKTELKSIIESSMLDSLTPLLLGALLRAIAALSSKEFDMNFWIWVKKYLKAYSNFAHWVISEIQVVTIPAFQ